MPASVPLTLTTTQVLAMQWLNSGQQHGPNQFFPAGSNLYYISLDQIGGSTTNNMNVYKSTDKTTWTLVATFIGPNGAGGTVPQTNTYTDAPACLIGTKIYIAICSIGPAKTGSQPVLNIQLQIFDTTTDTFLTASSLSDNKWPLAIPVAAGLNQLISISPFNNGTILVSCSNQANDFTVQIYTPGADTWGAVTTISAAALATIAKQIHDPVSDLAFVFYQLPGAPATLRCATVANTLTFTDVLVTSRVSGPAFTAGTIWGDPIITTTTTEVILPFEFFPASGPPFLKAARATVAVTPVFTIDTVEDLSTLPVGFALQQWDQIAGPGWMAQEIAGTVYIFYDIDNGDLDSALSQSFLYYRSYAGAGVWGSSLIAFTSAVPGESLIPYGTKIPGFDPIILVGVIDPTLWPNVTSLTTFILFPAAAPPPTIAGNPGPGQVGVLYSTTFTAGSGTPPYTFSITLGSLCAGLSLNASTGVVSGIPTSPGTCCFTVTVTDSLFQTASIAVCITIGLGPAGSPAGGGPYVIPKPCKCDINETAFEALEKFLARKREWPYAWRFPRGKSAVRVTAQNFIAVPTVAAGETQGLAYTVDMGFNFALERLVVEYLNGGLPGIANPGDFTWSLDINKPVGVGSFQGMPVQGFTRVDVPLGTLQLPWPLEAPEIYSPNDVIRAKFFNVNLLDGAPNYFKTILLGWRWPVGE